MRAASTSSKMWEHGSSGAGETGWTLLNLTYAIEWPLHILFTSGVLERFVPLSQK